MITNKDKDKDKPKKQKTKNKKQKTKQNKTKNKKQTTTTTTKKKKRRFTKWSCFFNRFTQSCQAKWLNFHFNTVWSYFVIGKVFTRSFVREIGSNNSPTGNKFVPFPFRSFVLFFFFLFFTFHFNLDPRHIECCKTTDITAEAYLKMYELGNK